MLWSKLSKLEGTNALKAASPLLSQWSFTASSCRLCHLNFQKLWHLPFLYGGWMQGYIFSNPQYYRARICLVCQRLVGCIGWRLELVLWWPLLDFLDLTCALIYYYGGGGGGPNCYLLLEFPWFENLSWYLFWDFPCLNWGIKRLCGWGSILRVIKNIATTRLAQSILSCRL